MSLCPSSVRVPPFAGAAVLPAVRAPALASPTAPRTRQTDTTARIRGFVTRCIYWLLPLVAGPPPLLAVHRRYRRALGDTRQRMRFSGSFDIAVKKRDFF